MKSARNVGWIVTVAALLWAGLPKPSYESSWESLKSHAYLCGHLLGWLPAARRPARPYPLPRGNPGARPSNGTIPEVQGYVDVDTFKAKYLYKSPTVFRNFATKKDGFDLECLTGTGKPIRQVMQERMAGKKIRVFRDTYDDKSAKLMTLEEYTEMARQAEENHSLPIPYARAFAQSALGESCEPIPEKKIEAYHGMFSSAAMLPEGTKALMFYSMNKGSTTRMHMDVGDSLFTQVYGRKKWLFVEPEYVTVMQTGGEPMNLFYTAGYDVHLEHIPAEVPIKEVTLHPGDMVYFPSMTYHAVVNLDEVTIGIDQPCMDFAGSLRKHWLLTVCSLLNPFMILKVLRQVITTGKINGHEVYFDDDFFSKKKNRPVA